MFFFSLMRGCAKLMVNNSFFFSIGSVFEFVTHAACEFCAHIKSQWIF